MASFGWTAAIWVCRALALGMLLVPLGRAWAAVPPTGAGERQVTAVEVELRLYHANEIHPTLGGPARGGAWVEGVARYRLAPGDGSRRLVLLSFPDALASEPVHLDEMALSRYIDGPFSPGSLEVTGTQGVSTVSRVGPRRDIVLDVLPGAGSVTLSYRIQVPRRYWPFGCVRGRCALGGAVAPLPSAPRSAAVALSEPGRVVVPARWSVTSTFATAATPTTRRQRLGRAHEILVMPMGESVGPGGEAGHFVEYPSVFFGPAWHKTSFVHRGVRVAIHHVHPRPSGQVPRDRRLQLRPDVPGQVQQIVTESLDLLEELDHLPPPDTTLRVVQGPFRSQVAAGHPGGVVLSDQAMSVLPVDRFIRFHQTVVARATLDALMLDRYRDPEHTERALWQYGVASYALTKSWEVHRRHRDEFAEDILRRFTFMPAVDRFLYTGQAEFSGAYFRGSDDVMPVRDHPLWFANDLPTGRRIYERLADLMSDQAVADVVSRSLADPTADLETLAEARYGHELDWFFAQWLGPYPPSEFAIRTVDRTVEGTAHRTRVVVEKRSLQPVVTPVQLYLQEKGGREHFLVWNGQLNANARTLAEEPLRGTHVYELVTASEVKTIRLDPRDRLVETPLHPSNVDPRFDNRSPKDFRFLYTGAGLDLAASELAKAATPASRFAAVSMFAAFEASLRRDLRRTGHLLVSHNRENNVSATGGLSLWFGERINAQRRHGRVSLFGSVDWLTTRRLDPRGGVRFTQSLSITSDTRRFMWWPERGRRLHFGVAAQETLRTAPGETDHRAAVMVDASWTRLWPITHDHVIGTNFEASVVIPLLREPEFRSLSRVGGIGGLSGYLADEIFGRAVFTAQAEYRHVIFRNLRPHLLHLAWIRGLGGSAFVGAASASSCEGLQGWLGAGSWYGQVGYGLMGYLSILGVTPQLIRVDAAVPLVRRTTQCLGERLPRYLAEIQGLAHADALLPPFSLNLTFVQPF